MKKHSPLLTGTLILTLTGLATRILGFFYRIYLSDLIGAEGLGIYQLMFPVFGICFSLCCGPIQTSISRYVASSVSSEDSCRRYFHIGLLLSLSAAAASCLVMRTFAHWISVHILLEERCAPLLGVMALSIPVSAIHSCICGYYYGKKKAAVPAFSQLAEQLIRVFSVALAVDILVSEGKEITPMIAVFGLLAGEAAAALFTLAAYTITQNKSSHAQALASHTLTLPSYRKATASLVMLALPLGANRLVLSVLQSAEAVMISGRLQMYGMSASQALSLYGVLNGMAMHFILFPSALTNSIAVMLLPDVAEAQSLNHTERIDRNAGMTLSFCLSVGILSTGLFLHHGMDMGLLFFKNKMAGQFITNLAWLCPFLYIATTMGSILNGMGKTSVTFTHNLVSLTIQLSFVIFGIPRFGITAYLVGMLVSELILCLLHILSLRHSVNFGFSPLKHLARPLCAFVLADWAAGAVCHALEASLSLPPAMSFLLSAGITIVGYGGLMWVTES